MELATRVRLTWAGNNNLSRILKNSGAPINLNRNVFESCIIPVTTYGLETMTFTQKMPNVLRVYQKAIERSILGRCFTDRIRNDEIRETKRNFGRPQIRWRDDIQRHPGRNWRGTAQDKLLWRQLEEVYDQEWKMMA